MDERLRDVEGDVGKLKDWRMSTVDPWMSKGAVFRQDVGEYITRMKAREELEDKLAEERHASNTFKLNLILAVCTVFLAIFGFLSVVVAYQAAHNHVLKIPFDLHSSMQVESAQYTSIPINP